MRGLIAVLALAGCEAATGPSSEVAGFELPAVLPGELQIVSPAVRKIPAGANVMHCSYLDFRFKETTDVVGFHGALSLGGHHAILYVARQDRPVDTHPCTEDDMINSQYLAGTGADSAFAALGDLPPEVGFRVPANAQLMIQTHFVNASLAAIDGQAAINIKTAKPTASRMPADLFAVANNRFVLPPGQVTSSETTCEVKEKLSLFFLAGHEHALGTYVKIEHHIGSSAKMLYDREWAEQYEFDPPLEVYSVQQPLVINPGDKIRIHCTWNNTSGRELRFPDEMCVAWGYYFPGHGEIDCVDGFWPE